MPRNAQRKRTNTIDPWLADTFNKVQTQLGPNVRELLREHGINQAEFAAEIGLSLSSLSDRLAGRAVFSLAEGLYLTEYFGLTLKELMKEKT